MAKWLRRLLRPFGLYLIRLTGQYDLAQSRLRELKGRGLVVNAVLDGGAAAGEWAVGLREIYPEAEVLCVEPRESMQPLLASVARRLGKIRIAPILLSEKKGEVEFSEYSDQSSMMKNSQGRTFGSVMNKPTDRLDALIEELGMPWPELLKFDVQGAELRCLRGAPRALSQAQAVILEIQYLPIYADAPLAAEVIAFMQAQGFRLFDLLSVWRRPGNHDLGFSDALFIREGHVLLSDGRWSPKAGWER